MSEFRARPRLGLMRLSALELLDKLQLCYGIRMLDVFKEAADSDLYSSLIRMYARYPYNDIALRHVTSIIAYSMDHDLAKQMSERQDKPKQRASKLLDLEPLNTLE
mgnify:CR=1 FL=1|jgi:hypothetical protein